MSTTHLARVVGLISLIVPAASAQINSSWTGGLLGGWSNVLNWSAAVPCNAGGFTYNAVIPGAAGTIVSGDISCTANGLSIIANNPLGVLTLDPRNGLTNEGGSLIATNQATFTPMSAASH